MTQILHLTDIHFGTEHRLALAAVMDFIKVNAPDLCIVSGDITQIASVSEFKAAQNWLSELPMPVITTPGNHDTPHLGMWARFFAPFKRYDHYIGPIGQNSYQDDRVQILTYNTARGWFFGLDWSIGAFDLAALKQQLAAQIDRSDRVTRIFVCHHPLIYPLRASLKKTTQNGPAALEMLARAGIDLVLTGHLHEMFVQHHAYDAHEPHSVYAIGGGTLSTRYRDDPPGFNLITLEAGQAHVQPYYFKSGQFTPGEAAPLAL